ncbi:MAG TPA: glycoside hydrolase family 3 N-terminal domain-containing protein [Rariglobus sp.]|jgi:beta-glucosidase|nr:glycoside hydrolase family 3 N-terminal domain-containing protein [Rariglobus sp.]
MIRMRLPRSSLLILAASLPCATALCAIPENPALQPLNTSLYHDGWIDLNKNGREDAYENSSLPVEKRIDDLLARMTLEEKTCQLATLYGYRRVLKDQLPTPTWKQEIWKDGIANIDEDLSGVIGHNSPADITPNVWPASNHARAINEIQRWFIEETRLGVPVDFTNEGLRGLSHANATGFPPGSSLGATWDRDLVREVGHVTGSEAFALGYTNVYAPILDVGRDQRWGRIVECFSEEPYVISELGREESKAMQQEGIASTLKHFAIYSIPKGGRDGTVRTDPAVAPREMRLLFLEPFKRVIADAAPLGVMSSYNDYDGVPISGSREFLTDILRGEFGFKGYVVSDSNAVEDITGKYHVAANLTDAIGQFLDAGGNVCTNFTPPEHFILPIRELVKKGRLPLSVVDARVRDVLRVKFLLGLFDRPYRDPAKADALVANAANSAISLRASRESITLLRNKDDALPLSPDIAKVLVCGASAVDAEMTHGRYGPPSGPVVTILDGIKSVVSPQTKVTYAKGCEVPGPDWQKSEILPLPIPRSIQKDIDDAVAAARDADVVILCVGDTNRTVGEGLSRTSLDLPGRQDDLARALIATGKPVIVVLTIGRPASINYLSMNAAAILTDWFPGPFSGQAVAEAIFGKFNPGGKSTFTFPRTVGQIPFNFPAKPRSQGDQHAENGDPNGSGISSTGGAIYPFGHGLSYTTFAYSNLKISPSKITAGQPVDVSCTITNTGKRAGDEVAQLYLHDTLSSVSSYEQTLVGFERVPLASGESKTVTFTIQPRDMELINRQNQRVVEPGNFNVMVGASSQDIRLNGKFDVAP